MDEFCGGDLWSDVINEFDNVKIDSISPLHSPSQYGEKEKYSVRLKIQEKIKINGLKIQLLFLHMFHDTYLIILNVKSMILMKLP